MNLQIEKIVESVPVISGERNYWFLRTFHGKLFKDYKQNDYVGFGLNNAPIDLIKYTFHKEHDTSKELIRAIQEYYKYTSATAVKWANQLFSFYHEVAIGDIVIIPSENSAYLAFGIIESDVEFVSEEDRKISWRGDFIPFPNKIRKVKWLKTIDRDDYKGDLSSIIKSQQGIININKYYDAIEGALTPIFIKEERAYLNICINQESDINAFELQRFLSDITYFYSKICELNGIPVNEDLTIKIKVQSKGILALKGIAIKGVIGVALIVAASNHSKFKLKIGDIEVSGESEGLIKSIMGSVNDISDIMMHWEEFKNAQERLKAGIMETDSVDSLELDSLNAAPPVDLELPEGIIKENNGNKSGNSPKILD